MDGSRPEEAQVFAGDAAKMATWRTHPVSKQEAVMFASRLLAFVLLLVQGALVLAQELTVRFRPEKEEYQL
ncbi:MAG: hypothetical protein DMG57_27585 [Acidobacteria bacterium]|nr:MAG: hypothetical protein DMG57_27585 [Acidobacteriota bacterium]